MVFKALKALKALKDRVNMPHLNKKKLEQLQKDMSDLKTAIGTTVIVTGDAHERIDILKKETNLLNKILNGLMKYAQLKIDKDKIN